MSRDVQPGHLWVDRKQSLGVRSEHYVGNIVVSRLLLTGYLLS